jgi:glycosyltransferase involved in cell wall biosynthesis
MARGKPVIASRVGGLPEVVIDESTGLLVDNDIDSVVGAIKRMSSDHELAGRCVDKAFERLSAQFTDDIMVRRTEEAYRSVMRKAKPSE